MTDAVETSRQWLAEMQECVRNANFVRCRAIFADDVTGFGTKAAAVSGLDSLERDQWRHIWGTIRDFTFLVNELHCGQSGKLIWLACPWRSLGPDGAGGWVERPGRITAVLEKRNGSWLAVHTHHSVAPATS